MYLNGMKYRIIVNTHRATIASQLRNGTVQLNVLDEKSTQQCEHVILFSKFYINLILTPNSNNKFKITAFLSGIERLTIGGYQDMGLRYKILPSTSPD